MNAALLLIGLSLVAFNAALDGDGTPSAAWLTLAAVNLLPLGFAPLGALSLIMFEAVPTRFYYVGMAFCIALLIRGILRLWRRAFNVGMAVALWIPVAMLLVMLVIAAFLAGTESGPTPVVVQYWSLLLGWAASIIAALALSGGASLAAARLGRRGALVAPIIVAIASVANLLSL
jgi:hypothetical protein